MVCLYLSTEYNANERHSSQGGILARAESILMNDKEKNTLVDEIDSVLNHSKRINPKIASRRIKIITQPQLMRLDTLPKLTNREIEIMSLVIDGYHYKEIARILNISFQTIKALLKNIFTKLGVNSRVEATLPYTKQREEFS